MLAPLFLISWREREKNNMHHLLVSHGTSGCFLAKKKAGGYHDNIVLTYRNGYIVHIQNQPADQKAIRRSKHSREVFFIFIYLNTLIVMVRIRPVGTKLLEWMVLIE